MKPFWQIFAALIFIIGVVMIIGTGIYLANDPCGFLRERHAERTFSSIQHHAEAMDRSLQSYVSPPSYMIAQLQSDLEQLQTNSVPACFGEIETALECAVQNEIIYADKWSMESGNPVADNARSKYQACMADYYSALDDLKGTP